MRAAVVSGIYPRNVQCASKAERFLESPWARVPANAAKNKPRGDSLGVMFFLLRVAFWLSIVVVLLPAGPKTDPNAPQVSTFEAIVAAQAAWNDARGFCAREPQACSVGSQAFHVFGQKAQNGAKMLYEFLSAKAVPDPANPDMPTGSTPRPGRDTLTAEDRSPVWMAPQKTAAAPRRG